LHSDDEYGEAFRNVLETSIRSRVRNHSRVGVRLSGGLDSSTVLALTAEVAGVDAVRAYSVIDTAEQSDETPYIDAACSSCGVQSTKVRPAVLDVDDLQRSAAEYEDFPDYPNGAPSDSLKRAAHEEGITALLTGVGGDDWFFGSPLEYADLIRSFALTRLIRTWQVNRDFSEIFQSGIVPLVPPRFRRLVNRALGRHTPPPWISLTLAASANLYERSQSSWDTTGFSGYSQRATLSRATNHLETHLIELEERSEWRFGFSQRHPFFDRRVVEFALSLPQQQKQRQPGKYKYITRHAMRGKLPPKILSRVDSPSGVPTIRQFLLNPKIASMIDNLRIAEFGWVVPGVVSEMHRHLQSGEIPAAHVLALWRIVGLEAWARVALS
jgi:asparagine synthase (glutamine-hydrolysing)